MSIQSQPKYLIISRHDFRSFRKTSIHFIAAELATRGTVSFFSISFSYLSYLTRDHRLTLWECSNKIEEVGGVSAFLWQTKLHPFRVPRYLDMLMDWWFRAYVRSLPSVLRAWIKEADNVFLEAGGPEIFFDAIKRINPHCRIIYLSSDTLDVIGTSASCVRALNQAIPLFDVIRVPSKAMTTKFSESRNVFFVPHGINPSSFQTLAPSPYRGGINVVSVGDMLFDRKFFVIAASKFSDINFHIIGGGHNACNLAMPNVMIYPQMPFASTLPYLINADAGVAAYLSDRVQSYLADTSLKLMQYGFLGLPAICPEKIAGEGRHRFGYSIDRPDTVVAAIRGALASGRSQAQQQLTWCEVTQRILRPEDYPDTSVMESEVDPIGWTGNGAT